MIGDKKYTCPHVFILGKTKTVAERFYKVKHFNNHDLRHRIDQKKILVALDGADFKMDLEKCVGHVKQIDITDNGLVEVSVHLYNVPNALIAENLENSLYLTPVGTGTVKDGVVQDDYQLYYFSLERR